MQLRDYQIKIAEQANNLLCKFGIAYLCMQVRTGKTFTAFEASRLYKAKKVLFVTKLKAISSIQKDFKLTGGFFDLYIINYESLHKCNSNFDLVILDECHCLGQYPTPANRVNELKRICSSKPIIYLSGTPSPESYSQFFHQFYVSSFSPWDGNFYKWHKEYGISKVKYIYNRQITDYSVAKKDMVLKDISHLMISYTQEHAGFTSFVNETILKLPMPEKMKAAIKIIKRDKVLRLQSGDVVLADTAVKEMQKVHQLCSGTIKAENGNRTVFDYSKSEFIKKEFGGRKIAIFYKYIAERQQIIEVFGERVLFDPVEFNKSGVDAVFISQVQSGREGIDLSTADCIVMLNIDFSAVSYWQARARLQTKTRTAAAYVYWLFTEGGIEEKIYQVVQLKKDFTTSHYKKLA